MLGAQLKEEEERIEVDEAETRKRIKVTREHHKKWEETRETRVRQRPRLVRGARAMAAQVGDLRVCCAGLGALWRARTAARRGPRQKPACAVPSLLRVSACSGPIRGVVVILHRIAMLQHNALQMWYILVKQTCDVGDCWQRKRNQLTLASCGTAAGGHMAGLCQEEGQEGARLCAACSRACETRAAVCTS